MVSEHILSFQSLVLLSFFSNRLSKFVGIYPAPRRTRVSCLILQNQRSPPTLLPDWFDTFRFETRGIIEENEYIERQNGLVSKHRKDEDKMADAMAAL